MVTQAKFSKFYWLVIAALVVIVDQYTKYLAITHLEFAKPHVVLPVFNLTLLYNTGAAFSFLRGEAGWQQWLFGSIAIIISVILVIWLYRLPIKQRLMPIALCLILGGALGNLVDRMRLGYVIDFISLHFRDWHFAVFNIADLSITLGALLIIIDAFYSHCEKPAK